MSAICVCAARRLVQFYGSREQLTAQVRNSSAHSLTFVDLSSHCAVSISFHFFTLRACPSPSPSPIAEHLINKNEIFDMVVALRAGSANKICQNGRVPHSLTLPIQFSLYYISKLILFSVRSRAEAYVKQYSRDAGRGVNARKEVVTSSQDGITSYELLESRQQQHRRGFEIGRASCRERV